MPLGWLTKNPENCLPTVPAEVTSISPRRRLRRRTCSTHNLLPVSSKKPVMLPQPRLAGSYVLAETKARPKIRWCGQTGTSRNRHELPFRNAFSARKRATLASFARKGNFTGTGVAARAEKRVRVWRGLLMRAGFQGSRSGIASDLGPFANHRSTAKAVRLLILAGLLASLSFMRPVLAFERDSGASFPFGLVGVLSGERRQTDGSFGSRPFSFGGDTGGRTRYVYGPRGDTWRISPGLSGGWITGPGGATYRVTPGLNGAWVSGPRGESWRITYGLPGGAWISGPSGTKTYRYTPTLNGGRLYAPDGRSWQVTELLSGTIVVR